MATPGGYALGARCGEAFHARARGLAPLLEERREQQDEEEVLELTAA
jgi:hypothetical protein